MPTFEFGTMHVILFHLALIPLTMSRFTIARASKTFLGTFVPFHEATKIHIFLGYVVIFLLTASTVGFFAFFGVLCGDGDQTFCDKFASEIMITGYIILATFIILAATSFTRHILPYRVFYIFHHLFLLAYAATIAHTIDGIQRKEGGRSQSFKWFSATLVFYLCDRASMYFNRRFKTIIDLSSISFQSGIGKKSTYLKVLKPKCFHFDPGQYVYLKIPRIDQHRWHPFSVASSPTSPHLEFYIEAWGDNSWTAKVWSLVKDSEGCENNDVCIECEVMG